ncbi:MAG TPA: SDR family oxidoreductase [Acidimicrobiales bacterium]|nr:SDR family oxidoreductase [Acidimicrobiales bacterium]
MQSRVLVVIGAGGMGQAIARRVGSGNTVLLADVREDTLLTVGEALQNEGQNVITRLVDVSSPESVRDLAGTAATLGQVGQIAHTAGLSPVQASVPAILKVDLLGVALVLDEFGRVVADGGSGVVISSMAGHFAPPFSPELERAFSSTPPEEILSLPFLSEIDDPGTAYAIAKRANVLRVQAASTPWGKKGARVNSVSPGIISTAMGRQELSSENGQVMRTMIESSPSGRVGTPDDIASAAAFLLGAESSFITGTDLLVDGGVVASFRFA